MKKFDMEQVQVKEKELLTEAPENDTLIKLTTDSIPQNSCFMAVEVIKYAL